MLFQSQNEYLSTVRLTKERFWEIRFFSMFLLYSFIRKRGFLMDIDLKEELKKRDKLLVVLCQEKVQIKCNQFSLCLAKLNLLFLSHYLLDFSDILPHIGLGINTRNGCEYVLYCKMFLCIQKSTYMHVYN